MTIERYDLAYCCCSSGCSCTAAAVLPLVVAGACAASFVAVRSYAFRKAGAIGSVVPSVVHRTSSLFASVTFFDTITPSWFDLALPVISAC